MTVYRQGLDISTELWAALLQDSTVFEEKDVDLMEALLNCKNHRATATELAEILDVPYYGVLNLQVGALGKRIVNKLPYVKYPINEDTENISYWQIPFWGEDAEKKGRYYWELRPELRKAIEELLNTKNIIAEEITEKKIDKLPEGTLKYITVNAYERNREARKKCIEEYGYTCSACGFNFEEVYGGWVQDTFTCTI